jgi:hypothetical protein
MTSAFVMRFNTDTYVRGFKAVKIRSETPVIIFCLSLPLSFHSMLVDCFRLLFTEVGHTFRWAAQNSPRQDSSPPHTYYLLKLIAS